MIPHATHLCIKWLCAVPQIETGACNFRFSFVFIDLSEALDILESESLFFEAAADQLLLRQRHKLIYSLIYIYWQGSNSKISYVKS